MVEIFGIRFHVPNEYGHVLNEILERVPIQDYIWKVDLEDIFPSPYINNFNLFSQKLLMGNEFIQSLTTSPPYYICFLKLLAFPTKNDVQTITTFTGLFQSSCKLAIFFTDAIFVEIYSMDILILNQLNENAQKYGYQDIEFIDEIGGKDLDLMDK